MDILIENWNKYKENFEKLVIIPCKKLGEGWAWYKYNDGSGHLQAPDGKEHMIYDLQTREYKENKNSSWDLYTGNDFFSFAEEEILKNVLKKEIKNINNDKNIIKSDNLVNKIMQYKIDYDFYNIVDDYGNVQIDEAARKVACEDILNTLQNKSDDIILDLNIHLEELKFQEDYENTDEYKILNELIKEVEVYKKEKIHNDIEKYTEEYFKDKNIKDLMEYSSDRDYGLSSLSEMYRELLEKLHIDFENLFTEDVSDGKYLTTVCFNNNKDIQIDTSAWNKKDVVIDNIKCISDYYLQYVKDKPVLKNENQFEYMLLDRLKSDCEYFLGNGNRNPSLLWADSVESQIEKMRELYCGLKEKPEWITLEDINSYEKRMKIPPDNIKMLKIIFKEAGKDPRVMEIEDTLEAKQHLVDGYIEVVPYKNGLLLVCNEEGKNMHLEPNLQFDYDTIVGNCFVIGDDFENAGFKSVDDSIINEVIQDLKARSIELEEENEL